MQVDLKQSNEKYLPCFKIVTGVDVFLGVGLLACGVLVTILSDDNAVVITYYVGGFIMGLMMLLCSFLNWRIVHNISNSKPEDFSPNVNTAIYGNPIATTLFVAFLIMISLAVPVCIASVVLGGVFGVTYGDTLDGNDYDDDEEEPDNKSENRSIAYSIIVGCVAGIAIIIYNCVIILHYKRDITQIINPGLYAGQSGLSVLGNLQLIQGTPATGYTQTNSQYGVQNQYNQQTQYSVGYLRPHQAPGFQGQVPNQQNFATNPSAPPMY